MANPHPSPGLRRVRRMILPKILLLGAALLLVSEADAGSARSRRRLPAISVSASTPRISQGGTASFNVRTSRINPLAAVSVNYFMAGTAVPGQHYSATAGTVVIPAGASSASVVITLLNSPELPRVATLRLQAGSGYKVSTPSRSSITLMPGPSPTPAPTPTPTPAASPTATPQASPTPSPQQEIWIAVRTDRQPGTGTASDPFDGSTPGRFDAILNSYYWTPNVWVHLVGAGPFPVSTNHYYNVRPGWVISGEGMYTTTVRLVGSLAGMPYGATVFASDPNIATNNVTIRDLTIDCNWPEIGSSAPDGANGEKFTGVSAVLLCGSNNLLERVRHINSYGSWGNRKENFAMFLSAPRNGDGTNNVIKDCRAELPQGTYGNPFALAGWGTEHFIVNSKVVGCTAIGVNNGKNEGFTSGGVNMGHIKNCEVDGNTFIDCYGAAYLDVGEIDGLRVTNNTVIRGWKGVGLVSIHNKQNIIISGNKFGIQNRVPGGASCGIVVGSGPENLTITNSNVTIDNNTITFDTSGQGHMSFWGIATSLLNNATISNNTIGVVYPLTNNAVGTGVTLFNNVMSDGSAVLWRNY